MTYARTAAQRAIDFADTSWEEELAPHLGIFVFDNTKATDRLDWVQPEIAWDAKEKRQPLSKLWTKLAPEIPEADLFIIDELSVRKGLGHWPHTMFVLKDRPTGRVFLAPIYEVIGAPVARVNRNGKGKWLLNLTQFRQVDDLAEIQRMAFEDLLAMPWKRSDCLSQSEIPEVA